MGSPYGPFGTSAAILLVAALFVLTTSVLGYGGGAAIIRLRTYSDDLKSGQRASLVIRAGILSSLAVGVLFFGSLGTVGLALGWTYGAISTQDTKTELILLLGAVVASFYSVARGVVTSVREVIRSIASREQSTRHMTVPQLSVALFALRGRIARRGLLAFTLGWVLPAAVLFTNYYEEDFLKLVNLQLLAGIYLATIPVAAGKQFFDIRYPESQMADLLLDLQAAGDEESEVAAFRKVLRYGPRQFRGAAHRAGWRVAESLERYLSQSSQKLDPTERPYLLAGRDYLTAQLRTAGRMSDSNCVEKLIEQTLALITRPDQVGTMQEVVEMCPRLNPHVPVPSYDQLPSADAASESRVEKVVARAGQFLPLLTDSVKLLGLIGLVAFLTYGVLLDFSADRIQGILRDLR